VALVAATFSLSTVIIAQTKTASTLCMKAVRQNRGRGGEEESARRSGYGSVLTDAQCLPFLRLLCNCEKIAPDCKKCNWYAVDETRQHSYGPQFPPPISRAKCCFPAVTRLQFRHHKRWFRRRYNRPPAMPERSPVRPCLRVRQCGEKECFC
jgi:hypothetical protein